jgi:hypothetical protein
MELGRKHRKREWDSADWGENVSGERENGVGFKLRSILVDFDRRSKSTQSIFGYCKWPYQHKDILRQCKQSNRHRVYFQNDVCFQRLFWRYNFDSNNTEVYHKSKNYQTQRLNCNGKLLSLPSNKRLGWKCLTMINTLAY